MSLWKSPQPEMLLTLIQKYSDLTWLYEKPKAFEPVAKLTPVLSFPAQGPTRSQALEIFEFLRMGDFLEISDHVNRLAQTDESLQPFAEAIQVFADNFDEDGIRQLLNYYFKD